ncbi:MAG: hypothetical protein K0S68_670 [Candidatus Saccharibacteria bacterium]|jgi:hypothetical protein|nr:hypothetical protein [Candidatus Saccharibacteria bacterium]
MRFRKLSRKQWAIIAAVTPVFVVAAAYAGQYIQWYTPVVLDFLLPWR